MYDITGDVRPAWYAAHRVLPYPRRAVEEDAVGRSGAVAVVAQVCERLPELSRPAARLHGELWNGCALWDADGRGRLIGPAAHDGHRETGLAMLTPALAGGWGTHVGVHRRREPLVHAVPFGRGYAGRARAAACGW